MSLPAAQPAEVLRAWQKDNFYEERLAGHLGKLLPPKHAAKAIPSAAILYKSFTTLKDLQTLGEEYSGIVQVDETYNKLPSFSSRLFSILLSVFGETITQKLVRYTEKQINENSDLRPQAKSTFLMFAKALCDMVPQFENIHRAFCYIYGGPIQFGKSMCSIDYVQARPAAAAYYAHLRLLGLVTLAHAVLSCGQSIHNARRHVEQIDSLNRDIEGDKSCVACLEELLQACVLPCGHIFCMQCCYGALETCALCRTPFTKNTVVPLQNYLPGR